MDDLKQHFRPSESSFVNQAQGWVNQASKEYRPILTTFLNPRQRYILTTLVNRQDELRIEARGIFENAENQRALVMPDYYQPSDDDFEMTLIEIEYARKFATLQHRTILGAMVHSGLKRESFGDIVVDDEQRWQVAVSDAISTFIQQDLTRMGNQKVKPKPVPNSQAITLVQDWVESDVLVTSLRLDTFIAQAYNLSRTQAKELIERGLVRINWTDVIQPDFTVAPGDLISVRGHGRVKFVQHNGITKKDKHRLTIAVIQK